MFGTTPPSTLPIVEVSIDESLDPEKNWAIGEAVAELRFVRGSLQCVVGARYDNNVECRKEGYLVIAGGLTIHTFENNMQGFSIKTAPSLLKEFDSAVIEAAGIQDVRLPPSLIILHLLTRADMKPLLTANRPPRSPPRSNIAQRIPRRPSEGGTFRPAVRRCRRRRGRFESLVADIWAEFVRFWALSPFKT